MSGGVSYRTNAIAHGRGMLTGGVWFISTLVSYRKFLTLFDNRVLLCIWAVSAVYQTVQCSSLQLSTALYSFLQLSTTLHRPSKLSTADRASSVSLCITRCYFVSWLHLTNGVKHSSKILVLKLSSKLLLSLHHPVLLPAVNSRRWHSSVSSFIVQQLSAEKKDYLTDHFEAIEIVFYKKFNGSHMVPL